MKVNMTQWVSSLCASPQRQTVPIMSAPGIELISATPLEVFKNGETQFRCIKALSENYKTAAAVTMMDLSVEAEAFGAPVQFSEKDNPTVTAPLINSEADALNLAIPRIGTGRTGECLKAAELCAQKITDRPSLGGLIGPYSLAGRLVDMTEMMMMAISEPEKAKLILEKATAFLLEYARAFKETGCQGIIMAEPAAGLLSPEMCHEFSSVYIKKIVESVQDEHFLFILHNCGNTTRQISSMLSTGARALHLGNAIKMTDILPQVPPSVLAMGNIDPANLLKNGNPQTIYNAVYRLLQDMQSYPNFVLSSGCDIPASTPLTNIDAFFNTLADYNKAS